MSKSKEDSSVAIVFDHIAIRRFIGLIAIFLPLVVYVAAGGFPDSISASYHTPTNFPFLPYFPSPRDIFVGSLFVIGAFLISYKGHENNKPAEPAWHKLGSKVAAFRKRVRNHEEDLVSTAGGIAAWIVALFPTKNEDGCIQTLLFNLEPEPNSVYEIVSRIHLSFAAWLFLTTVYFCLVAFKRRLDPKISASRITPWYRDPLQRRRFIYNLSGWTTLLIIAGLGLMALILPRGVCFIQDQTYWAETVMLELFGIAWFSASKPVFLRTASEEAGSSKRTSE